MDVERLMEFVLKRQAEAFANIAALAAGQQELRAAQAETDKRLKATGKLVQAGMKILARVEQRLDEHAAVQQALGQDLRDLAGKVNALAGHVERIAGHVERTAGQVEQLAGEVKQLAGEVKQLAGEMKELKGTVNGLAAAQKTTERNLNRLIQSLSNGKNGSH